MKSTSQNSRYTYLCIRHKKHISNLHPLLFCELDVSAFASVCLKKTFLALTCTPSQYATQVVSPYFNIFASLECIHFIAQPLWSSVPCGLYDDDIITIHNYKQNAYKVTASEPFYSTNILYILLYMCV